VTVDPAAFVHERSTPIGEASRAASPVGAAPTPLAQAPKETTSA
jgi:hypothetical protein